MASEESLFGVEPAAADFDEKTDANMPAGSDAEPEPSFDSMISAKTGGVDVVGIVSVPAHGASVADLLDKASVLELRAGIDVSTLTPFEQHVATFIDGERSVARIEAKTGLSASDLRIALTMLGERGAVRVVARMQLDLKGALGDDLDDSDELALPPPVADGAPPSTPRPASTRATATSTTPKQKASGSPAKIDAVRARTPEDELNELIDQALNEFKAGNKQRALAILLVAKERAPTNGTVKQLIAAWSKR